MPQDAKHRRSWFDALAADHKFDPLVAHFWYQLSEKLSDIQVDSFLNIYDHIFYLYIYSNLKSYIYKRGYNNTCDTTQEVYIMPSFISIPK